MRAILLTALLGLSACGDLRPSDPRDVEYQRYLDASARFTYPAPASTLVMTGNRLVTCTRTGNSVLCL